MTATPPGVVVVLVRGATDLKSLRVGKIPEDAFPAKYLTYSTGQLYGCIHPLALEFWILFHCRK